MRFQFRNVSYCRVSVFAGEAYSEKSVISNGLLQDLEGRGFAEQLCCRWSILCKSRTKNHGKP